MLRHQIAHNRLLVLVVLEHCRMGVRSYMHGHTRLVNVLRIGRCWSNVPHYCWASSDTSRRSLTEGTNYAVWRSIPSFHEGDLISATSISGPVGAITCARILEIGAVSVSTLHGAHALHELNFIAVFVVVQLWTDHSLCLCHLAPQPTIVLSFHSREECTL